LPSTSSPGAISAMDRPSTGIAAVQVKVIWSRRSIFPIGVLPCPTCTSAAAAGEVESGACKAEEDAVGGTSGRNGEDANAREAGKREEDQAGLGKAGLREERGAWWAAAAAARRVRVRVEVKRGADMLGACKLVF